MSEIIDILMRRDGMTKEAAEDRVSECKEEFQRRLANNEMPFEICEEYFGLEEDYIDEIM